jgi:hypothetical protein
MLNKLIAVTGIAAASIVYDGPFAGNHDFPNQNPLEIIKTSPTCALKEVKVCSYFKSSSTKQSTICSVELFYNDDPVCTTIKALASRCDPSSRKDYGGKDHIYCKAKRIGGDVLSFEGFRWNNYLYTSGFNL